MCQRIPFRTRRKRIWHSLCAVHTYTTKDTHKILPVSTGSAVRKDAHTKQNMANNCDEFPFCVLPLVYKTYCIVLHSIVNTYSSLVDKKSSSNCTCFVVRSMREVSTCLRPVSFAFFSSARLPCILRLQPFFSFLSHRHSSQTKNERV